MLFAPSVRKYEEMKCYIASSLCLKHNPSIKDNCVYIIYIYIYINIESFRLKKPLRSSSATVNLTVPSPLLNHVPKHHIYISFRYPEVT